MRRLVLLAWACLVGGVALLAYGAATGEVLVHLVLIFPVFTGSGLVPFAGMLLIVVAIFLGFLSMARGAMAVPPAPTEAPAAAPPATAPPGAAPTRRFGGVVFLGPIPIVFGSDAKVSKYMLILAIILSIIVAAFFLYVLASLYR